MVIANDIKITTTKRTDTTPIRTMSNTELLELEPVEGVIDSVAVGKEEVIVVESSSSSSVVIAACDSLVVVGKELVVACRVGLLVGSTSVARVMMVDSMHGL